MEENLKVAILEKQILRCLFENNELLDKRDIDCFISPQAQEFYVDLLSLKNNGKKIMAENILTLNNEFLTSDLVLAVLSTDYDVNEFDSYVEKLEVKALIHEFKSDTLSDLNETDDDFEKLDKIRSKIELVEKNRLKKTNGNSFSKMIQEYKGEIEKRSKGVRTTTGDYNLDKLMGNYQAGLVFLVGMSGSMKSTFVIKLLRNRITKRLPTCAINTELTHATYMDTLVSTMIDEKYNDLLGLDDGEMTDWDAVLNKLTELEMVYSRQDDRRRMFDFYPSNSVSISDIKSFCKKCRKDFRLKDDEILFCTIDLYLMIRDMNKSGMTRADAITQGTNELNEFALSNNVLFLATIQSRRLQNQIKIEKIEDLNSYRIGLERLKESSSLEERGRVVIALHNPKYLVNRNPCPQIIRDLVDPILELTVLKNTWQDNLGKTVYYYIDSDHKDLIDYVPKDGEVPNSGDYSVQSDE